MSWTNHQHDRYCLCLDPNNNLINSISVLDKFVTCYITISSNKIYLVMYIVILYLEYLIIVVFGIWTNLYYLFTMKLWEYVKPRLRAFVGHHHDLVHTYLNSVWQTTREMLQICWIIFLYLIWLFGYPSTPDLTRGVCCAVQCAWIWILILQKQLLSSSFICTLYISYM